MTTETLFLAGLCFFALGAFLVFFTRIASTMLVFRKTYAARLESEGQVKRAETVRNETGIIKSRTPIYGRIIGITGLVMVVASFFSA